MASYLDNVFRINGIVSTDKTVMQNLDTLAGACATWMTYDTNAGQWAVVPNQPGTSVASFSDSNILGAITVSGSGIDRLYNSVRVEFPHIDLNDNKDFVLDTIPAADWYPNEIANTLNMQFDCINDPVQAEYVGLIELKQGRLDQVVRFQSDFSRLGLTAGDLIDITSTVYGFANKVFRILSIKETDTESGAIILDITAQEYSDAVYSTTDLYRYTRTNSTGIVTMGAIGTPGTPEVNKTELNSRPRVTISSTVPTGRVEAMEFWYTPDTYTYDVNRVYTLLETVKPSAGNTLTYGNTITVTNDALPSGNLYVKTRGINGVTTGPFSTPAGFVYTPVQTTDAISETTQLTQGGSVVSSLGALALMTAVNGLFSGNTASGSLFGKIFDTFKANTGVDLVTKANAIPSFQTFSTGISRSTAEAGYNLYAGTAPTLSSGYDQNTSGVVRSYFTITNPIKTLLLICEPPLATYKMQVDLNLRVFLSNGYMKSDPYIRTDLYAYVPTSFQLFGPTSNFIQENTSDWQTPFVIMQLSDVQPGTYDIACNPLPTYLLENSRSSSGTEGPAINAYPYNFVFSNNRVNGITINGYGFTT